MCAARIRWRGRNLVLKVFYCIVIATWAYYSITQEGQTLILLWIYWPAKSFLLVTPSPWLVNYTSFRSCYWRLWRGCRGWRDLPAPKHFHQGVPPVLASTSVTLVQKRMTCRSSIIRRDIALLFAANCIPFLGVLNLHPSTGGVSSGFIGSLEKAICHRPLYTLRKNNNRTKLSARRTKLAFPQYHGTWSWGRHVMDWNSKARCRRQCTNQYMDGRQRGRFGGRGTKERESQKSDVLLC